MERPPAAPEPHAPTAEDQHWFPGAGNDVTWMTPQLLGRSIGGTIGLAWTRAQATHLPGCARSARSPEEEASTVLDVCVALVPLATLVLTGALTAYGLRYLRD
jgi:hypothetical protein